MREMSRSGIPWIGEIPIKWQVGRIKNGYNVTLGKMISPEKADESQTLENYLCAANIKFSGVDTSVSKQMWFSDKEKEQFLLSEGDLLIMEGGMAGTACQYQGEFSPCYIQNSVHRIRRNKIGNNRFLYYWMNVVFNSGYVNDICNKATILHYTKEKVECTPVLYPTVREQEAIVSYLDNACSKIDEAISRHKQIIEKLEEYRKAVITKEIREICEYRKIKHLFRVYAGATPKSNIPEFWDGSINWITPADYKTSDKYISGGARTITEKGYQSSNTTIVPKGSIIISKRAPIGSVGIANIPLCTNQGCLSCVPSREVDSEFYYYVLSANTSQMNELGSGTTFQELSATAFLNMKVPYITFIKQKEIAEVLNELCTKANDAITHHRDIITKLEEYRKSIIYNAVTGKIDCRDSKA